MAELIKEMKRAAWELAEAMCGWRFWLWVFLLTGVMRYFSPT